MGLFDDKGRDVHDIYRAFPEIKEKGASLAQISDYLKGKNYFCVMRTVSEAGMLSASDDRVYISLIEHKETPREGYLPAHLIVKRKLSRNELQIIDFLKTDDPVKIKSPSKDDTTTNFSLIISKSPVETTFPKGLLFFVPLALSLFLVLFLLYRWRRSRVSSQ